MAVIKDEKIERWIDLDKFIHTANGRIDWIKSVNIPIRFTYGGKNGTITILSKLSCKKYLVQISCDGYTVNYEFNSTDIKNCKFGRAITVPIAINYPELIKYFANKDDAYKYSAGSGIEVEMICPMCGAIVYKSPRRLVERGLSCLCCSDGISWPNKFMFNILDQLDVDFKREVTSTTCGFEWIKYGYRYDFCIWLKDKPVLIEMDGHYHFQDGYKTYDEVHDIDIKKDQMANENGIDVVRIDCNYKDMHERFDYIKNNILRSSLADILNLNIVNWRNAYIFANNNNNIYLAARYWNEGMNSKDIEKKLKVSKSSTRSYLIIASQLKLCDYDSQKSKARGAEFRISNNVRCKPIVLFYNQEMIGVHPSASDLHRLSYDLYGKKFSLSVISNVCNKKLDGFDGYVMEYVSRDRYEEILKQLEQHKINEGVHIQ